MVRMTFLAALLFSSLAHGEDQVRKVDNFYGINVKGPISVYVEVGKPQAVSVSGESAFVSRVQTAVEGGVLRVTFDNSGKTNLKGDNKITVTVPALTSFRVMGAGEAVVKNIGGERIDVSYEGAGAMHLSGKVKLLRLKGQGVGQVNTRNLLAERADVNFNGMGDVAIYASDTLNLVVQGMGDFKYFGHPKHINKSVQGLGSVGAGD